MQLGLVGVLTVLFVTLKLLGVIAWSWIWVLAPVWVGFILFIALLILVMVIGSKLSKIP
jgi:hypothetical protein